MPLDASSGESAPRPPQTPQQPLGHEHVPRPDTQPTPEPPYSPPLQPRPAARQPLPPQPQPRRIVIANLPAPTPRPAATHPQVAAGEVGLLGFAPQYEQEKSHRGVKIFMGSTAVLLCVGLLGGLAYEVFTGGQTLAKFGIGTAPRAHDAKSALPAETATQEPQESPTTDMPPQTKSSSPTTRPTKAVVVPIVPTAETCVDKLPDATLIAQKIMAPVYGDNLMAMTKEFETRHVGGAILMTSPKNPDDGSILAFKKAQSIAINVATDQEGGDPANTKVTAVSRIKAPITKLEPKGYMPSAAEMAKMTPDQITATVAENYSYLKSIGIDTSFGTVVDVAPLKGTTKIGASRIASSDPTSVITYAASYIAGAKLAGVNTVIKHGGMGSASANTDTSPAIAPNITALKLRDFTVYTALRAAGLKVDGMIGSEAIPGLTIDAGKDKKLGTADDVKTPASLSKAAVDLFKADYLAGGVKTYTDDLGAPGVAVNRTVTQASIDAWKAGMDVALFVNTSPLKATKNKMTIEQQLDDTIKEGVAAMTNKTLPRSEVVASDARILAAKHVGACALLKQVAPNSYKALTVYKPTPSVSHMPYPLPAPAPKVVYPTAKPGQKPTVQPMKNPVPTTTGK